MSDMAKAYDFSEKEESLYQWWEEKGWFKPEVNPDGKPFVISIPPPNVTGQLHQGHALFAALEDLMIRRARMQGRAALWVPGTDHAGIATQLQVEKMLRAEGSSRQEIGREAFLKRTWAWKDEYGGRITHQLRRLGASCDWDRERFTMDDGLSRAVREAFVRMYRMGLIYQGEYLVNWSPGLQTAVSDLEVESVEEEGFLYFFKYPLKDGGFLEVATTRPETILGDTAVAVHPDDERYQHLIGQIALVPMINREIPIIADTYVNISFGSGALKVTPGHDANDFEIGKRHQLPTINAMNKDATMSMAAGQYAGMDRFACREKIWADMEALDLVVKKQNYKHSIPRSQRGGEVIEPLISRQWFVDAEPMAKLGLAAVENGRIKIVPERFNKTWYYWLENIRPWCISRQLWWGHRIPVWYCDCGHQTVARVDPTHCEKCGSDQIKQDDDVLDTWFSSALWPFSTLGWPDQTEDLARYYPTDVLETGYDILFFWVARMVMSGLLFTNEIPFHTIYLHGLVRDEHGRKMSKSIGNVVDPLEVMAEYGTDALRLTLLTGGTPGNDMNLAMSKVESNRNFANKVWNLTRFIVTNLEKVDSADKPEQVEYSDADKWILSLLSDLIENVDRLMDGYQFGEAGRQIHDFVWDDFADWYVELAKVQLGEGGARSWTTMSVLLHVLDSGLRLLHPYVPYVTEAAWQELKKAAADVVPNMAPAEGWAEALIIAKWPEAGLQDSEAVEAFERLRELVRGIRGIRAENKVPPGKRIAASIATGSNVAFWQGQKGIIAFLARLDEESLLIENQLEAPETAVTLVLGEMSCYLPLAGMVDLEQERARLEAELIDLDGQIERVQQLLASPFAQRAPEAVVLKEKQRLAEFEASRAQIQERLNG